MIDGKISIKHLTARMLCGISNELAEANRLKRLELDYTVGTSFKDGSDMYKSWQDKLEGQA